MNEKRNATIIGFIFGLLVIWLCYAEYTGWRIYNSDKVVQDNEQTSSGRIRTGNGFHHK